MFLINETIVKDEEGRSWNTYGITCGNIVVNDISTERSKIEKLVNVCNKLGLQPEHMSDIIEEFLVHDNIIWA